VPSVLFVYGLLTHECAAFTKLCFRCRVLDDCLEFHCVTHVEHVHVQVMAACFEIFSTWDDEYDKLQGLLRDIVKKKKEDMKLAWKVNPTHKRLQARLDQMRKSVRIIVNCASFLHV